MPGLGRHALLQKLLVVFEVLLVWWQPMRTPLTPMLHTVSPTHFLQARGVQEQCGQHNIIDPLGVTCVTDSGDLMLANTILHPMAIADRASPEAGPSVEGACPAGPSGPPTDAPELPPRIDGPSSRIARKHKDLFKDADDIRRQYAEDDILDAIILLHATMRSAGLLRQCCVGPDSDPIGEFTVAGPTVSTSLAVLVPLDEQEQHLPLTDKAALHDLRLAQKFPDHASAASADDLKIAPFKVVSLFSAIEWAHCMWSRSLPTRGCKGDPVLGRYHLPVHGQDIGVSEDSPLIIFMLPSGLNDEELAGRLPALSGDARAWLGVLLNSGFHKAFLRKNNQPTRALISAIGGAPILRALQQGARDRHRGVCALPFLTPFRTCFEMF